MLKNNFINRQATLKIARALGVLNSRVVFVGGAMVSLYGDDPAAEDVRPTKDIDLTFQLTSLGKLEQLREELITKGFRQTHEDDVICSADLEDIVYLFNYSTTLVKQISAAEHEVLTYLQQVTEKILADERILSAISGHLYYETADERMVIIKEKMKYIVDLEK